MSSVASECDVGEGEGEGDVSCPFPDASSINPPCISGKPSSSNPSAVALEDEESGVLMHKRIRLLSFGMRNRLGCCFLEILRCWRCT